MRGPNAAPSSPGELWRKRAFSGPVSPKTIDSDRAGYFRAPTAGRPLSASERAPHEGRFGINLSAVRVHEGEGAEAAANALRAEAYAAGENVVLGKGVSQATLGHELHHVAQQRGRLDSGTLRVSEPDHPLEREAEEGVAPSVGTATATLWRKVKPAMSRVAFENAVKTKYGVQTVRDGTAADQGNPPDWSSWSPGNQSEVYDAIVESFESVRTSNIGGMPKGVTEIVFFKVDYVGATSQPDTGAAFGGGKLEVFKAVTNWEGPEGRSVRTRSPLPTMIGKGAAARNITHELGHALFEAALKPATGMDLTIRDDFAIAVGWKKVSGRWQLFDLGTNSRITEENWNDPWGEQPMSKHSLFEPFEDFAESFMAYVHTPKVLLARSPARYNFIDGRKSRWSSGLNP